MRNKRNAVDPRFGNKGTFGSRRNFQMFVLGVLGFWILVILYMINRYFGGSTVDTDTAFQSHSHNNPDPIRLDSHHLSHRDSLQTKSQSSSMDNFWFFGELGVSSSQIMADVAPAAEYKDICTALMDGSPIERKHMWSQSYQEWYIYHNFFHGKTDGIYVDMGSHKPLHLSNSAFFDVCLGWKGICVEPSKTADEFADIRSCNMARHCMWSESKTLVMVFRSEGDASLIIDKKEQERIKREQPEFTDRLFECNAVSAVDLFNNYKVRNKFGEEVDLSLAGGKRNAENRIDIDLISLDVEGAEVEVLKCFPFNHYDVKVWTIEVNRHEINIDEIMLAHGYVKVTQLTFFHSRLDAVYVKWPRPQQLPWRNEHEVDQWNKYERCPGDLS